MLHVRVRSCVGPRFAPTVTMFHAYLVLCYLFSLFLYIFKIFVQTGVIFVDFYPNAVFSYS